LALVTFWGNHPEPSLGWPDGCALRPWPARGRSKRNLSLAFRKACHERPPLAALWLAAARKRSGPWFTVRFHRGEYERLYADLADAGWGFQRTPTPYSGARSYRRARRRDRRLGPKILKARDALRYTSPNHWGVSAPRPTPSRRSCTN
jgi:hypothetical protein